MAQNRKVIVKELGAVARACGAEQVRGDASYVQAVLYCVHVVLWVSKIPLRLDESSPYFICQ